MPSVSAHHDALVHAQVAIPMRLPGAVVLLLSAPTFLSPTMKSEVPFM